MQSNFKPDLSTQCAAIGCTARIPRFHLMCLRHWDMVSCTVRAEVYATARAGRVYGSRVNYLLAVTAAQMNVATEEGKPADVRQALQEKYDRLLKLKSEGAKQEKAATA